MLQVLLQMKTWLVLDVHYLCHRAFHTARGLSWQGKPTGVIYGFLKSILTLKDEFQTDRIAFCFEHPHLYRKDIYPAYKRRRHQEKTPQERQAYTELTWQISELRQRYLPKIGFTNILYYHGMEADDILASIAESRPRDEQVILVTADSDLLQCLRPNVMVYPPQKQKLLTREWFVKHYGFTPRKWAMVKALAGCSGDGVEGIKGIGEKTACRWVRDGLPVASKGYRAIACDRGHAIMRRNRRLVELPYEGCPVPTLVEDRVSRQGWKEVCHLLGMRTLVSSPPVFNQ